MAVATKTPETQAAISEKTPASSFRDNEELTEEDILARARKHVELLALRSQPFRSLTFDQVNLPRRCAREHFVRGLYTTKEPREQSNGLLQSIDNQWQRQHDYAFNLNSPAKFAKSLQERPYLLTRSAPSKILKSDAKPFNTVPTHAYVEPLSVVTLEAAPYTADNYLKLFLAPLNAEDQRVLSNLTAKEELEMREFHSLLEEKAAIVATQLMECCTKYITVLGRFQVQHANKAHDDIGVMAREHLLAYTDAQAAHQEMVAEELNLMEQELVDDAKVQIQKCSTQKEFDDLMDITEKRLLEYRDILNAKFDTKTLEESHTKSAAEVQNNSILVHKAGVEKGILDFQKELEQIDLSLPIDVKTESNQPHMLHVVEVLRLQLEQTLAGIAESQNCTLLAFGKGLMELRDFHASQYAFVHMQLAQDEFRQGQATCLQFQQKLTTKMNDLNEELYKVADLPMGSENVPEELVLKYQGMLDAYVEGVTTEYDEVVLLSKKKHQEIITKLLSTLNSQHEENTRVCQQHAYESALPIAVARQMQNVFVAFSEEHEVTYQQMLQNKMDDLSKRLEPMVGKPSYESAQQSCQLELDWFALMLNQEKEKELIQFRKKLTLIETLKADLLLELHANGDAAMPTEPRLRLIQQ